MSDRVSDGDSQSSFDELSNGESKSSSEGSHREPQSSVEISIGRNNLRINGSEDFISKELSTILDRLDFGSQPQITNDEVTDETMPVDKETPESRHSPSIESEEDADEESDSTSKLKDVADRINVPYEALSEYFYMDGDEIHIHDPREIKPKYALIGYCTLKEELHNDTYHDNTDTKKKLIDNEKVNIEDWGGTLLYNLRESGYIKDNPNSQKSRFKPFKITPSGREELVDWLNEDN